MPFAKRWESTSSADYSSAANWARVSVRNGSYSWTASGSGTNEYYLRTSGGADPGFAASPGTVQINGSNATEGTAGSLTAGQWDYADNDTLGYSTIYVRLSDGADPDSKALDFVTFRQIPQAGDDVRIPAGTASITTAAALDQSAVAIADFIVEEGYTGDIGSSKAYLRIDPDRFEFGATGGTAYIDIRAAAISAQVHNTGSAADGERGLYLLGSAIAVLTINGGDVGVATRHGETASVTTVRLMADRASLWIGEGCTLTNWHQFNGDGILRAAATTVLVYDGSLLTQEIGAITTLTQKGGEVTANSTGTITTYNLYDGTLILDASGAARTISTLNKYRGSATIRHNKEAVTITTETRQDSYVESIGA